MKEADPFEFTAAPKYDPGAFEDLLGRFDNDNFSANAVEEMRVFPGLLESLIRDKKVDPGIKARQVHRFLKAAQRIRGMFSKESSVTRQLDAMLKDVMDLLRAEIPEGLELPEDMRQPTTEIHELKKRVE